VGNKHTSAAGDVGDAHISLGKNIAQLVDSVAQVKSGNIIGRIKNIIKLEKFKLILKF